jgi:hypothetical protein
MPLSALVEPLVQGVTELLIRAAGRLIIKYGWYRGRCEIRIRGGTADAVGLAFWTLVIVASVWIYKHRHLS